MDSDFPSGDPGDTSPQVDELVIFNTVVSAMKLLNDQGRLKLFRTVASFLDIPLNNGTVASVELSRANPTYSEKTSTQPVQFSEDRSATPKQFLFEKKPQTDGERIACLAYYLTHYRATPHFKTLELSKLNTEAAQIKLSNPTAAVDNASRSGLLVQVGQGKKQLSAIGELYVEALPDREAAKQAFSLAKPRRLRPRAKPTGAKNK